MSYLGTRDVCKNASRTTNAVVWYKSTLIAYTSLPIFVVKQKLSSADMLPSLVLTSVQSGQSFCSLQTKHYRLKWVYRHKIKRLTICRLVWVFAVLMMGLIWHSLKSGMEWSVRVFLLQGSKFFPIRVSSLIHGKKWRIFPYLQDRVCSIFSSVWKFCLAQGLRQLTWDTRA